MYQITTIQFSRNLETRIAKIQAYHLSLESKERRGKQTQKLNDIDSGRELQKHDHDTQRLETWELRGEDKDMGQLMMSSAEVIEKSTTNQMGMLF